MARIDDEVERIMIKEPHLTRAEAIKLVAMKRDKIRSQKQADKRKKQAQERRRKGKPAKGSIKTVSGGAVSPR